MRQKLACLGLATGTAPGSPHYCNKLTLHNMHKHFGKFSDLATCTISSKTIIVFFAVIPKLPLILEKRAAS